MSNMRKNKKGSIIDIPLIIIVVFAFIVVSLTGMLVFTSMNDALQNSTSIANQSKIIMNDNYTRYPNIFDGIITFFFIGLSLASIIGAFLIKTHPAFAILSFIILLVFVLVAAVFSNAYETLTVGTALSAAANNFPASTFFLGNFVWYIMIISIVIAVVMYAKQS